MAVGTGDLRRARLRARDVRGRDGRSAGGGRPLALVLCALLACASAPAAGRAPFAEPSGAQSSLDAWAVDLESRLEEERGLTPEDADRALVALEAFVRAPEPDQALAAEATALRLEELGDRAGFGPELRSRITLHHSWILAAEARFGEAVDVAETGLARFGERTTSAFLLAFNVVQCQRQRRRFDLALDALDVAEGALAAVVDPERREASRLLVLRERILALVDLGLPDRALGTLDALRAAGRAALTERGDRRGWGVALVTELTALLALDDHEGVVYVLDEARLEPEFARLDATLRDKLLLRESMALAELERQQSSPFRAGRDPALQLEAVLRAGSLDRVDVQRARQHLAALHLDRGELEAAGAQLEAWRASLDADSSALLALEVRAARLSGTLTSAQVDARLAAFRRRWRDLVEGWRARPLRASGVAPLHFAASRELLGELIHLHRLAAPDEAGLEAAFEDVLALQAAGSLARRLGAAPVGLAELRADLLSPDELALVLVPAREECFAFTVTRDSLELNSLPAARVVYAARRGFAVALDRALRRDDADSWAELQVRLVELSEILLPPDLDLRLQGASRLSVIGTEAFGYVPFEALSTPGAPPLGVRHALRYLPSIPVAVLLQERARASAAQPSPSRVALLAAAAPDPSVLERHGVDAIPLDALEARELLAPLEPSTVDLAVPGGATHAALVDLLGRRPVLLQLLAHGVVDFELERPAALLLEDREPGRALLGAGEVESLEPLPGTVLLTACGAWRGPRRRGDDGAAHLTGAFLAGGSHTVVLSEAPVRLRFVRTFTPAFYRELAAGVDLAEALRRVRAASWVGGESADPLQRLAPLFVHAVGLGLPVPLVPRAGAEPATAPAGFSRLFHVVRIAVGLAGLALFALALRRRRPKVSGRT